MAFLGKAVPSTLSGVGGFVDACFDWRRFRFYYNPGGVANPPYTPLWSKTGSTTSLNCWRLAIALRYKQSFTHLQKFTLTKAVRSHILNPIPSSIHSIHPFPAPCLFPEPQKKNQKNKNRISNTSYYIGTFSIPFRLHLKQLHLQQHHHQPHRHHLDALGRLRPVPSRAASECACAWSRFTPCHRCARGGWRSRCP